ncbi:MAG: 5'-nucleotidase [Pseudomonadaceae bacterium]|nr:5'-nucleotidase [Pseudomonadaceae bacterium]
MPRKPLLTVAISSRALFDLGASNEVYEQEGLEAYRRYQIDNEDEPLEPGEGFPLVVKLLNINKILDYPRVEVILLSRNSADTGLRVFNAIKYHNLTITRAAFCGGRSPYRYVRAFNSDLFLSTDGDDVAQALSNGVAAATLLSRARSLPESPSNNDELRLAFDGDSVLFSDEAEQVYQREGLAAFAASEASSASKPLEGGPFKGFLAALHALQEELAETTLPIRTALVTARGAPAHERVIRTLRAWDIRLDESLFLGGLDKTSFLASFGADVFFDDQRQHVERAASEVAAGHVPHGITNEAGPGKR